MARATPSPLLSDISGKVGSSVFARYRGVLMVRAAPVVMSNPNSAAQANVRAAMVAFGTAWRALTTSQVDAWEHFAQSQTTARSSIERISKHNLVKVVRGPQTGYDAFLQINMNRYLSGVSIITDILTTAPIGLPRPVGVASLSASVNLNQISVTWTTTEAAEPTDRIQIWIRSIDANIHKQLIATADADSLGPVTINQVRSTNGTLINFPLGTYEIQTIIVNADGLKCAPSEIITADVALECETYMALILPYHLYTEVQGNWIVGISALNVLDYLLLNDSGNNGDEFTVPVFLNFGTYTMSVMYMKESTGGKVDISLDGSLLVTIDMYAAAGARNLESKTTGIVIAATGAKTLSFKLNGKNAASIGYTGWTNAIQFTRTA